MDIFVRADGSYGFEEYRRDPEDNRGWYSLHHYAHLVFNTQDEATSYAKATVPWLIAGGGA